MLSAYTVAHGGYFTSGSSSCWPAGTVLRSGKLYASSIYGLPAGLPPDPQSSPSLRRPVLWRKNWSVKCPAKALPLSSDSLSRARQPGPRLEAILRGGCSFQSRILELRAPAAGGRRARVLLALSRKAPSRPRTSGAVRGPWLATGSNLRHLDKGRPTVPCAVLQISCTSGDGA